MRHYDLVVIGSGPAGLKAAIQTAKYGRRVAMVERGDRVGGVSVHTGTIPSKTLREAALYLSGTDQRGLYGRSYRLKPDLTIGDLMQRLEITVRHEIEVIENQLARNGIHVLRGSASFIDAHRLCVEGPDGEVEELEAEHVLIATGTRPQRPDGIPFDDERVLDSDSVLKLRNLPRSLTVVGAGVIGVEYASLFSTLDIPVTLVDGREGLLGFMDREIVQEFMHQCRDRGMVLRLGEQVERLEKTGDGQVVTHLRSGKQVRSEVVLFAAGRIGCTTSLKLENAGLEADERHRIHVNDNYQTAVPHIYAAGDVIGFPALASTSMQQGRQAACHIFQGVGCKGPADFPFGIYSVPEMSMVGMTEQELAKQGIAYETGIARLRETARGQIMGLQDGMLKLLFDLKDHRILGVHILGEGATELIHIGQTVLILGGTLEYFLETVFNYPTLAEAYQIAALDGYNRVNT
ncbi:MAG: Si-specific NAD(P)(+) transhydrogenase [Gammaproteobacteria bacterium]|nr:Si-specific NAD(P)(+) transhydrogenase [Gammaproteobacteria bacterium]